MNAPNESATVLVDPYRNAAKRETAHRNHYKGLQIHALTGLHEVVAERLREVLPPPARLVDLASGSGAMTLRLTDLGYSVTATDYVAENFRLHETIPFVVADLNGAFAANFEPSDAIVAVEIIEHLENPRHFFRGCASILRPGGLLVVSTPNLRSPVSKALLLREDTFQWFSDAEYASEGHINPVSPWLLRKCAEETGFAMIHESSHGDPYRSVADWRSMRWLARAVSALSATPATLQGECYIAIFQRRAAAA